MDTKMEKVRQNPLISLMRQPKIYIKLPSNGDYWPATSLSRSINGEYPVYSMTARDELILKTPDALMNGQAVVDVIQSCMPNILNAWDTPNIDMDTILIAIRLATYGEKMSTTVSLGGDNEYEFDLDLRALLDQLSNTIQWENSVPVHDGLVVYVKPMCYRDVSRTAVETFETQKIISIVNDSSLTDDEKLENFRKSFTKLTEITVSLVAQSVYRVDSMAGSTEDSEFISEFLENCDKSVFEAIKNHLDRMKATNSLKPIKVDSTPEMRANGLGDTVEVPVVFDPSNFFA